MSSRQASAEKASSEKQGRAVAPPARESSPWIGSSLLGLQQALGNRAVSRLLTTPLVQTKLRIGPPGDVFEQEADRVAQSVVSMSRGGMMEEAGPLHSAPAGGIQRKCAKCEEEEEETLRRSPADGADTMTEAAPEQESTPPTAETAPEQTEPAPEEQAPQEVAPEEKGAATLLVDDEAEQVGPGQMRKSEFLGALRKSVCATANDAMASTGQTTENCPWIDYWFDQAAQKDAAYVERALRKYAPETSDAATAQEFIPIVAARVKASVEAWVQTGEITGVPEGVSTDVPGAQAPEGGGQQAGGGAMQFKARPGGARRVSDPEAIRNQLGAGRPMPGGVRSRMESAFGLSFSQVRIHNDTSAGAMSDQLNARAFTVGEHVAFAPGEYQPGSLVGDALLAHELAHVVQQGGAQAASGPMMKGEGEYDALEQDADRSAVGAVAAMWGKGKAAMANISANALPRLGSGLRLSKCSGGPSRLEKTTVTGPTAVDCGGFDWIVQWLLDNPTKKGGWVVQNLDVKFDVKDCSDKAVDVKATTTVDPAAWPYWEAWQINKGQKVTTYAEKGDTKDDEYTLPAMGDNTKGTIRYIGTANFYDGLTLPKSLTPDPNSPAGILPVSRADPGLTGGTGALAHNLTATWDCCKPDKKTKVTTT